MRPLLLLISFCTFVSGCETANILNNPCFESEQVKDLVPVTDERLEGKWIFEGIESVGEGILSREMPRASYPEVTILFTKDGILSGKAVNYLGGKYALFEPNKIEATLFNLTQVNDDTGWEMKLFEAVDNAACYSIKGRKLHLFTMIDDMHKVIIFGKH